VGWCFDSTGVDHLNGIVHVGMEKCATRDREIFNPICYAFLVEISGAVIGSLPVSRFPGIWTRGRMGEH
jgi:hypothetical protein